MPTKDPRKNPRNPTVNEALLGAAITHEVGVQRYAAGLRNRIVGILNAADADIESKILTRYAAIAKRGIDIGPATTKRLEQIRAEIRETLSVAYGRAGTVIKGELGDLAKQESAFQLSSIKKTIPVKVSFTAPAPTLLTAIADSFPLHGKLLKDWTAGLLDGQAERIDQAVKIGLVNGETVDQLATRVRGTAAAGYVDGVLEIGKRSAEAVVRTSVNAVTTRAREITYAENPDLVKGVRWVSTLDMRTTEICMARDGEVYPVDEGPRPPAHWGCRSTTAPVLVSYEELGIPLDEVDGTRASMDGQVPESWTYGDWLERQTNDTQEEILGPTKAALFRDGGVTLDKFVDESGRAYTIDELRKHDSSAFEKAGL